MELSWKRCCQIHAKNRQVFEAKDQRDEGQPQEEQGGHQQAEEAKD